MTVFFFQKPVFVLEFAGAFPYTLHHFFMAFNTGQYGVRYDPDDRRPAWPWFVAFCVVIAALALAFALVRRQTRQIAETQPAAAAAETPAAAPAPTAESPAAAGGMPEFLRPLFAAAEHATKEGFYQDARARWLALLEEPLLPDDQRATVEKNLSEATLPLLTTGAPMAGKINYLIKPGDAISKIARRHGMTQEMLMRMNNLNDPSRIVAGRTLVVLDKPAFSLRVNRANGHATLLLGNGFVKRWPAQPGRGDATPAGEFAIGNKIERPAWWLADGTEVPNNHPENILGSRWMSLSPVGNTRAAGSIGLHGTGGRESNRGAGGSVRMANADIEELYWMIPPGTPVTIE